MSERPEAFSAQSNLPKDSEVIMLLDQDGVLELTLEDVTLRKRSFSMRFEDYLTYRKGDESDFLRTFAQISEHNIINHLLYEVFESEFIKWFVAETLGVRANDKLRHFIVSTRYETVDVICFSPPKFVLRFDDV